ncbi:hypothetical protein GCM10028808_58970 [Spirosoma migulaei]
MYIAYHSDEEHYTKNVIFSEMLHGDKPLTYIASYLLDCINIAFKMHQKVAEYNGFLNNINKLNILLGDMLFVICYKKCFEIDEFECFKHANKYVKDKYEKSIVYENLLIDSIDDYINYSNYKKGDLNILSFKIACLLSKTNKEIAESDLNELGKNIGILEMIITDMKDIININKNKAPYNNLFYVLERKYKGIESFSTFENKKNRYKEYKNQMQYIINHLLNDCTEFFNSVFDETLMIIYTLNVDAIDPILEYTQNLKIGYDKEISYMLDYDNLIYNKII